MLFAQPHILWLLLVFPPALVGFFWWSWRKRQALMVQFIQTRLLSGLVAGISPLRQRILLGCLVLAVACLIVALARPQWGFTWEEVKQRGVDIVVAIDTSKSMLATDVAPNRLTRAKLAALELMQQARSDRLGLVAFAGAAFLACPLTIDDSAFRQSVEALGTNTISQGGTALAEAIQAAMTAFKEGDNHRVLVLLTDGEDHESGAVEAAQKAAQAGLRIYTIGIGTTEGDLLPPDLVRDEQGNAVKSHLNERLLQDIASASAGGFYLHLSGAKTIDVLYNEPRGLAHLPKSEHQEKLVKRYYERYQWPLGLAILLLVVEMLLPERKAETRNPNEVRNPKSEIRRTRGQPAASSDFGLRTASQAPLLYLAALLFWPASGLASPSSALRDYKSGKYEQSLKEYEQLLKRKGDDPRLHFNAGAAAYRNGQFDEAARQFDAAVAAPDLNLQALAYYNRGNTHYWLGDQIPDPGKRTEAWQQSLKDYELSLKLNPQDADAKFNHEFVRKRLEELKQQQQNKQDQNKSDQKQDQNQQQDQQKQDQNQQQQAQQNQDQQKKQDEQQQQEQQRQQQQQQQAQPDQQQAKSSAAGSKEKEDEKEREAAAYAAGQMTPEQAQQLLDSDKGEEMMLPTRPDNKPMDRSRPLRDW